KTAPVQFELCFDFAHWVDDLHYTASDVERILQQGLDWHMSVFNGKSTPVPAAYRAPLDNFLKKVGYRLVLTSLNHTAEVSPGGALLLQSRWENKGVAPVYHRWPLAFRLRGAGGEIAAA